MTTLTTRSRLGCLVGAAALAASLAGCDLGAPREVVADVHGTDIAAGDLDGDGDVDLVLSRLDSFAVLLADGQGNYVRSTYGQLDPEAFHHYEDVELGDVDGDGDFDVILPNILDDQAPSPGYVTVGINDGSGALTNVLVSNVTETHGNLVDSTVGDVDGDGAADVLVLDRELLVMRGDGTGAFTQGESIPLPPGFGIPSFTPTVDAVRFTDVDGDGDADIVVSGAEEIFEEEGMVAVLLGDGAGGFVGSAYPVGTSVPATTLNLADVDVDGTLDLVVGNGRGGSGIDPFIASVSVLLGNGDGTYGQPVTTAVEAHTTTDVEIADIDEDGWPDVVASHGPAGAFVLFGDGTGALTDPHFLHPAGGGAADATVIDHDGDGVPDVAMLGSPLTLFRNALDGERTHP